MTSTYMQAVRERANAAIAREDAEAKRVDQLRDLAHVLDAHMEEGQVTPAGRELVSVALGRVFPDRIHTVERCDAQECRDLGCEECPCDADWKAADARLAVWLNENPRPLSPTPDGVIKERGEDDADLNARLKAAGMYSIPEMMGVTPLSRWKIQGGMTDLDFFQAWLERRIREFLRMKAGYELGDKDKDDELYEWVLAHSAALSEVRENFLAARARDQRAEREDAQRPRPEAASPVVAANSGGEAPGKDEQTERFIAECDAVEAEEAIRKWRFRRQEAAEDAFLAHDLAPLRQRISAALDAADAVPAPAAPRPSQREG